MGFELFSIIGLLAVVFILINIVRLPNAQEAKTVNSIPDMNRSFEKARRETVEID
jgi:hypothetical protein